MAELDLNAAVQAHLRFQQNCYIDELIILPSGLKYICSHHADDIVWNRAIAPAVDEAERASGEIIAEAARCGRKPAAAVMTAIDSHRAGAALPKSPIPERWMAAVGCPDVTQFKVALQSLDVVSSPQPQPGFIELFGQLYEDEGINDFFKRNYVSALEAARESEASVRHLLYCSGGNPAACASIYVSGNSAGLYNVGVHPRHQRNGIGSAISLAAMEQAFSLGAETVYLQCAVGTHVERMYSSIGFSESVVIGVYEL
jgi:GNAT superfamily N-acetyltransferase